MRTVASWILESLAATAVIVACLGSASALPLWVAALSVIPMIFYLVWRLDRERFAWRFALSSGLLLSGVVLALAYVFP
ncbi:MAG TPA: hypothetical protein VKA67_07475, partial [Verrucomicrobiae bacterium]|nr:hypothetical protein [Verrucomicrobiae bacterium]